MDEPLISAFIFLKSLLKGPGKGMFSPLFKSGLNFNE